jgi:hypothetical protein
MSSSPGLYFSIISKVKFLISFDDEVENRDGVIVEYYFDTGAERSDINRVCFLRSSGTSRAATGRAFPGLWFPIPGAVIQKPNNNMWIIKGEDAWDSGYIITGESSNLKTWVKMPEGPEGYFALKPKQSIAASLNASFCSRYDNLVDYFGCMEHMLISYMLDSTHFDENRINLNTSQVYQGKPTSSTIYIPSKNDFSAAKKNGTEINVWESIVVDNMNEFLEQQGCCRIVPGEAGVWYTARQMFHNCFRKQSVNPTYIKDKRVGGRSYNKYSKKSKSTIKHIKKKYKYSRT